MAATRPAPEPRLDSLVALLIKTRKESLAAALRLTLSLQAELSTLDTLQDLSLGTKAEFGCGMDHVRQGFDEMKESLMSLVTDG